MLFRICLRITHTQVKLVRTAVLKVYYSPFATAFSKKLLFLNADASAYPMARVFIEFHVFDCHTVLNVEPCPCLSSTVYGCFII